MFFFRKKKEAKAEDNQPPNVAEKGRPLVITLPDEMTAKESLGIFERFAEQNKIPIFKGKVEHAYESDFLKYKDKCPRCGAPTQLMMSNFPYATQENARILTAPAGHFCTACPTVIIDDDIIKSSIDSRRYRYGGVFSVDSGYSDKPSYFSTLNGQKTIYLLDDFQNVGGIAQSLHLVQRAEDPHFLPLDTPPPDPGKPIRHTNFDKKKVKKKNKQASQSRKANRRK